MALTSPIRMKSAKAGDSVYAQTAFPVAVNNRMAIPPGTYVQGVIDSLSLPGWMSPHAQLQFHFTKLIFANGYTVELSAPQAGNSAAAPDDVIPAMAGAYVMVSSASDVLLDNGSQIEMVLQVPVALDADRVNAAVHDSRTFSLDQLKPASRCRPIPGSPGSPDTVIPGSPGTPGTPSTTVPGGPGMPDIVIPGTPPTPGTPTTVLPGSPATAGIPCPAAPIVSANPKAQSYRQAFQMDRLAQISGKLLPAGSYEAVWKGLGPMTQVEIRLKGDLVATVPARVVLLNQKAPADKPEMIAGDDGTSALQSLRFSGLTLALYFDQGAAPAGTK